MYLIDDELILSPSDLNGFVECRHLTRLDLARSRGELTVEPGRDPLAELLAEKGIEHEAAYLGRLRDEGVEVAEIAEPEGRDLHALRARAQETAAEMRRGAEVIFQATFFDPPFRGHADFLFRVGRPSDLGPWSYEVADTKLARRAKPYFLIQLCAYSELLERVQGGEPPEYVHVILGTGERESFRLAEFSAYYRRVRDRFLAALAGEGGETYPEPCAHCSVCGWRELCDARRSRDDHLSLVAGSIRRHRELLGAAGINTLAALGRLDPQARIAGIRPEQLEKIRRQAALQLETREHGQPALELLEPVPGRGLARLPRPSAGDVFFDIEGDPLYDDGLEYLFGYVTVDGGEPAFTALWGRERAEEREALEGFIDFVTERRRDWPDLHVYHYAHYEVGALKRLAGMHATREEELDQLLRDEVFVDLYKVVREAMRLGQPSYGLKKVEAYYMDQRETAVTDGNASVVEFERWLEQGGADGGDQAILDEIAAYNRDDCVSTLRLRDWLIERRDECERETGARLEWFDHTAAKRSEDALELAAETAGLVASLCAGIPDERAEREPDQQCRWLLAQLLDYHRREARPVWWMFFSRIDADPDELIDDADCVGGLDPDPAAPPVEDKRSTVHRMTFPAQETKLAPGASVHDPARTNPPLRIVEIDPAHGRLELRRGPSHDGTPLPKALVPGGPYDTREQQAALRRLATSVIAEGLEGGTAFRACRDLLRAGPPRVRGIARSARLYDREPEIGELRW